MSAIPENKEDDPHETAKLEHLRAILDGKASCFVLSYLTPEGDWFFTWEGGAVQCLGLFTAGVEKLKQDLLDANELP
jgi:hypothetical protein